MITAHSPAFDLARVLAHIDTLASQRPVAARIVAATNAEDTDAKQLAGILAADMALASRVLKLSNSAYYGMRGRVASLQLAVTVVGFTTVRTMTTVAMTDLADESRLPDDFWTLSTRLGLAASHLALHFGERPADALCLGLLTPLGAALLYQHDRDGYGHLLQSEPTFHGRRRAERVRYGMTMVELTAVALESWGFPDAFLAPLVNLDNRSSPAGGLLRGAYEVVARLSIEAYRPTPIGTLTAGRVLDGDLPAIIYDVRNETEDMRQLLLGDD